MAQYHSICHPDHLEPLELEILHRRDAFGLPPKVVQDTLVDVFFKWIAPILPVVDRHAFMRQYNSAEDLPSILLLQAMLMVASRCSTNQQGSKEYTVSPRTFYKKAKALYDAGYETNQITVIQSVILLGAYWEGPDDLTESGIFYWSRLGIALAQELGLHESEIYTDLQPSQRGLRKRIWWTLYTRDRSVAAAFGRPLHINPSDCTVEPLTESDFVEHDGDASSGPKSEVQARFFMEYVKLCQLMDLGLCLNLSARSTQAARSVGAAQCELGLNEWLVACPPELHWRQTRHTFLSAILFSTFYTIVCQLHLLQAPYSSKESQSSAFHAASTIVSIQETLLSHNELQYSPTFVICHAVTSIVTLKHQMDASLPSLLHGIRLKLESSLEILEALSKTWPIATLFLEFFQTMTTPEHFNRLLSVAVEDCRKRALGDKPDDPQAPRRPTSFKRPKLQQVVLPQSRVVFQILARETQRRQTALLQSQGSDIASRGVGDVRFGSVSSATPGSVDGIAQGGPEDTLESCEPTAVLQNLREIIRIGNSQGTDNGT
ncbi:fungal specific transcription factor domain protein [Aspergillus nomiae NRRL 13137]|uniref:Fungal specific transcription factor domain protein n=1 Tax=Aspergillus nomiae NRRL (strain ATCC 15546 / NRRL 13137 / CBS 260.88 / M93) TaxID=1509407 RepID=A0A0L1IRT5_ASPN3|nr:fungal specific transcription factor domain protein [Aspergillus nomiae NRRL 13137]KNG82199.1 fungal specific transcription factor domain protein [Aspergillus nomiae NRRL 13137]